MFSFDLFIASPGSDQQDAAEQKTEPVKQSVLAEKLPDTGNDPIPTETVRQPTISLNSDIELLTLKSPENSVKLAARTKYPAVPNRTKSELKESIQPKQKTVTAPTPPPPDRQPKEALPVQETRVTSSSEMVVKTKLGDTAEQEKLALENEKLRQIREYEQRAAAERAQEQLRAAQAAKAEEERLEQEKAAKVRLATEQAKAERAALEQAQRDQAVRLKKEEERLEREKAAKVRLATEKAKAERAALEQAQRDQAIRLKKEEERLAREKERKQRLAAEKAAKERLELAKQASARTTKSEAAVSVKNQSTSTGSSVKADVVAAVPVTAAKQAASNGIDSDKTKTAKEQKGLALPPVKGDIKLIMTSDEDLLVKVLFVSHPKARHDKPLTKKEAREQQKLSPVIVKTAKNTAEAVIEHARDGIYIFLVEQQGSKALTGKFSLKLFETRNRKISEREIRGLTEIARLLMPEGVLWEDDTAFTGSIEDSESLTKFNSDTGVIWKEYRK